LAKTLINCACTCKDINVVIVKKEKTRITDNIADCIESGRGNYVAQSSHATYLFNKVERNQCNFSLILLEF